MALGVTGLTTSTCEIIWISVSIRCARLAWPASIFGGRRGRRGSGNGGDRRGLDTHGGVGGRAELAWRKGGGTFLSPTGSKASSASQTEKGTSSVFFRPGDKTAVTRNRLPHWQQDRPLPTPPSPWPTPLPQRRPAKANASMGA